jgi:AcrR family transcriptional regulator
MHESLAPILGLEYKFDMRSTIGRSTANDASKFEGLRERKKRATRQLISDTATRLFIESGFDRVTVDDVAAAANVAKATVFNYFSCKEDLFFDRTDDAQQLLRDALARRGRRSPISALRTLAHDLIEQAHPVTQLNRDVASNWKVVADSPALRARAYDLLDELEQNLAQMLALSAGAPSPDPLARLIAATLLATWRIAFTHALRQHRSTPAVTNRKAFLDHLDRGFAAATAAARGTSYAKGASRVRT